MSTQTIIAFIIAIAAGGLIYLGRRLVDYWLERLPSDTLTIRFPDGREEEISREGTPVEIDTKIRKLLDLPPVGDPSSDEQGRVIQKNESQKEIAT